MTFPTLKVITWSLGLAGAIVFSMEPNVKVAIIVAIPSAITGVGTLVLGFLNRRDALILREHVSEIKVDMSDVKKSVDGVKDDLVRAVKKEAFAAGEKRERDDPHVTQDKKGT